MVFSNARIQSPAGVPGGNISFTFDFDPAEYGMQGTLTLQRITPTFDDTILSIPNAPFQKSVSLSNLDLVAYKIIASGVSLGKSNSLPERIEIFPNPANNRFGIKYKTQVQRVEIYNSLGQMVLSVNPVNNSVNISGLSSGIYHVIISEGNNRFAAKLVKK